MLGWKRSSNYLRKLKQFFIIFSIIGEEVGQTILYFGCRRPNEDYLYKDELEQYQKDGTLTLYVAFSREKKEKVYVTHLLEQNKDELWDVIGKKNGHIYVCGWVLLHSRFLLYERREESRRFCKSFCFFQMHDNDVFPHLSSTVDLMRWNCNSSCNNRIFLLLQEIKLLAIKTRVQLLEMKMLLWSSFIPCFFLMILQIVCPCAAQIPSGIVNPPNFVTFSTSHQV